MRDYVIEAILREKIIAIVRGVDAEKLIPAAEALYEGGIRLIEITYSANGAVSDENTALCIGNLARHFEGRMLVGAGTVITEKQVQLTKDVGGLFIISPNADARVIGKTRELGMVSIPGALTPTECMRAHDAGADFVKLFPVSTFGPGYVKAIRAPLSQIKFLAVGGIDENNMGDYLKAGVCGFGVGSNIVKNSMIDEGDFVGITALAEKYVQALRG